MDINRIIITEKDKVDQSKKASEIIKSLQGFSYRNAKLTLEKATAEIEYRAKQLLDETLIEDTKDITLSF